MNTLLATVTYNKDKFLDNGLRFMEMSLPAQNDKGSPVPLLVFPNKAAGETFDVFQPGVRLLINGRIYPSRYDKKMYFIPNQEFQVVNDPKMVINRVNLSGIVGFVPERKLEDLFAFTLICNAPKAPVLNYDGTEGLGFRLDGWGDDARRLMKLIHVGRGVSVEGNLRYNTWKDNNGNENFAYQVRIRSGLYQCFGKNKNLVEKEDGTPVSSGYKKETKTTTPVQQPTVDATPCSINTDEIPF